VIGAHGLEGQDLTLQQLPNDNRKGGYVDVVPLSRTAVKSNLSLAFLGQIQGGKDERREMNSNEFIYCYISGFVAVASGVAGVERSRLTR